MKKKEVFQIILLAAGSSTRMKTDINKVFLQLGQMPVLEHSLKKFLSWERCKKIILVTKELPNWIKKLQVEHKYLVISKGGNERFHSFQAALEHLDKETPYVLVHDAARPLFSIDLLEKVYKKISTDNVVIPYIKIEDTIRNMENPKEKVQREKYIRVQTPQAFSNNWVKKLRKLTFHTSYTDEASCLIELGAKLSLVEGEKSNQKITTMEDFKYLSSML